MLGENFEPEEIVPEEEVEKEEEEEEEEVEKEGEEVKEQQQEEIVKEIEIVLRDHDDCDENFGEGGYLVLEHADGGTLTLLMSRTAVKGALAYFKAVKPISGYKYTHNGGRTVLQRKTSNKQLYFQGWIDFARQAFTTYFCSEFHILPAAAKVQDPVYPVMFLLLAKKNNTIFRCGAGKWLDLNVRFVRAIAVVSITSLDLDVSTAAPQFFVEKGNISGKAIQFDISAEDIDAARNSSTKSTFTVEESSTEAIEKPNGPGAYLLYSLGNRGTLTLVWSTTAPPHAIAYFEPRKKVAAFKFGKQGITFIKDNCKDKKNFMAGITEFFFRQGIVNWDASRFYLSDYQADLSAHCPEHVYRLTWLECGSNKVHQVARGRWFLPDPSKISMAVGLSPDVTVLDVHTMAPSVFSQRAAAMGGSVYCMCHLFGCVGKTLFLFYAVFHFSFFLPSCFLSPPKLLFYLGEIS